MFDDPCWYFASILEERITYFISYGFLGYNNMKIILVIDGGYVIMNKVKLRLKTRRGNLLNFLNHQRRNGEHGVSHPHQP